MRLVPKYKKDYGWVECDLSEYKAVASEIREELKKKFRIDDNYMISERSNVFARLNNEVIGYTVVSTKSHLPNNISAIDQETWKQVGEVLKECMEKLEKETGCHGFIIVCPLGELASKAWLAEKWWETTPAYDDLRRPSEFQWIIFPGFDYENIEKWALVGRGNRPVGKDKRGIGTMENERLAEKLRDPEGYYAKWKGDRNYLKHKNEWLKTRQEIKGREREREHLKATGSLLRNY